MASERLSISDAQKQILVDFYERGMVSTKKGLVELRVECASAVGLSETQVKNWISNYKAAKKLPGEPRQNATKAVLVRKRSGYNVFAKEQLTEGDSKLKKQKFSELGAKWKYLTDGEKEEYREKARSLDGVQGSSDIQRSKKIVKNIMKEVAELDNIDGVECLVVCMEGGSIYHASTKFGQKFLNEYPGTVPNFASVIQIGTLVGKSSPLPYSKAESLGLKFDGLPSELLDELGCFPKQPNHYGAQQKKKLWESRNSLSFSLESRCLDTNTCTIITDNSNKASASTSVNVLSTADQLLAPSTLPSVICADASKATLSTSSLEPSTQSSTPSPLQPQRHSFLAPTTESATPLTTSHCLSQTDGQAITISHNGLPLQLKEG